MVVKAVFGQYFSVGVPVMINHKTVTGKVSMTSDEEKVLRKIESGRLEKKLITLRAWWEPVKCLLPSLSCVKRVRSEMVTAHRWDI